MRSFSICWEKLILENIGSGLLPSGEKVIPMVGGSLTLSHSQTSRRLKRFKQTRLLLIVPETSIPAFAQLAGIKIGFSSYEVYDCVIHNGTETVNPIESHSPGPSGPIRSNLHPNRLRAFRWPWKIVGIKTQLAPHLMEGNPSGASVRLGKDLMRNETDSTGTK